MWDSYGTYIPSKSTTTIATPSSSNSGVRFQNINSGNINYTHFGNYYYSPQNIKYGKNIRVNIDNAWNPVDTYIYGPTQSSIFNQENKYGGYLQQKLGNGLSSVKESFNYIANTRFDKTLSKEHTISQNELAFINSGGSSSQGHKTTNIIGSSSSGSGAGITGNIGKNKRRLMLEIYDYETPKLCDHTAITSISGHKLRPCSPFESYVSSGRDLVSHILLFNLLYLRIFS